jgi:glycosyltransferase involved in cell wall biosynthesis
MVRAMRTASIVIPTLNRVNMVGKAIDSALAQDYPCEVVVFDAGSKDGTKDLCESYGDKINYYRLPKDPGYMCSWYIAASMATGEIIHWGLDDDWMEPTYMSRCIEMLLPDVGMVFTEAMLYFDDATTNKLNLQWDVPATVNRISSESIEQALLGMQMTISPSCWIARRKDILDNLVVGKLPYCDHMTGANEVFMTMSLLKRYPWAIYIKDPLVNFLGHAGASTIYAIRKGGDVLHNFLDEYRQIKDAYFRMKDGL